ncbi:MAG: hypothetical protein JO327_07130 [Nitrososphaeraceae archaeon]|nr:hypothetical protein [Nitrososphaeraceae archaeon]MBV9667888.1 hypothetical protein [Nitrososphaeraceae archaeon]
MTAALMDSLNNTHTTIGIAIIIFAIALVRMATITVNYSPTSRHAVKDTCKWFPEGSSGGPPYFNSRHQCETTTGLPCGFSKNKLLFPLFSKFF